MRSPILSHWSSSWIAVVMWSNFLIARPDEQQRWWPPEAEWYCAVASQQRRHCSNRFGSGLNFAQDGESHPVWETEKQTSAVSGLRSWSSQDLWCVTSLIGLCRGKDRDRGPRSLARQHPYQWRKGFDLIFPPYVRTSTRGILTSMNSAAIDCISSSQRCHWCSSLRRTADAGHRWNQDDRSHRSVSHPRRDDHADHAWILWLRCRQYKGGKEWVPGLSLEERHK